MSEKYTLNLPGISTVDIPRILPRCTLYLSELQQKEQVVRLVEKFTLGSLEYMIKS